MFVHSCLPHTVTWVPGFQAVDVWCPLLLHLSQNLKSLVPSLGQRKGERGGGCVALSGALEERGGCPDSPVLAAVALGQVNAQALTLPEAVAYFYPKGGRKSVWWSSLVFLHPLRMD